MTAAMKVPMTALRHVPWVSTRPAMPASDPTTVGPISERGRGARPRRWRVRPPRTGMPAPTTSSATRMTIKGTSSAMPVWGSHECWLASESASDCSMPMAMPAATMGRRYWNRPTTAAASAGTTNSV
jgi:hypothetical protein